MKDTRTPEQKQRDDLRFNKINEELARMKNPKLVTIDQLKEDINLYKFLIKSKKDDWSDYAKEKHKDIIHTLTERIKQNKIKLGL